MKEIIKDIEIDINEDTIDITIIFEIDGIDTIKNFITTQSGYGIEFHHENNTWNVYESKQVGKAIEF
jgi:tRNA(Phe) wybutosine-synthesizing methylase Tyw3